MTVAVLIALAAWLAAAGALGACATRPAASADAGRELYGEHGCASCHGREGQGDGPVGKTIDPPPRDFRDAGAFRQGTDVAAIAQTIAAGVAGRAPGTGTADRTHDHRRTMPRFDHLSESERRSLALYVISLRSQTKKGTPQP